MKTLKFLILSCAVACFSIGLANAQPEKYDLHTTIHYEAYIVDCIGETLTGDLDYDFSIIMRDNGNMIHDRFIGTLMGDVSGDTYTLHQVTNQHGIGNANASNWRWQTTLIIHKDGKPVSKFHFIIFATGNDATWNKKEGNWDVWVERSWYECY